MNNYSVNKILEASKFIYTWPQNGANKNTVNHT